MSEPQTPKAVCFTLGNGPVQNADQKAADAVDRALSHPLYTPPGLELISRWVDAAGIPMTPGAVQALRWAAEWGWGQAQEAGE